MSVWKKARKKPIIVEFREVVRPYELIETLEGTLAADPEKDYIIKGVNGEIYPIKKTIFSLSYEVI
jgi:hypothetical protein